MGANLEKSLFAPRAYAVPLCPKGEIVFVCSLRSLWSCYTSPAFAVFVCFATSKSLYTSRATLYSLYMVCVPMQSLYNQKRKSLAYLLPPLQSLNTSRTFAVSVCSINLKSLHHVTKPYVVSIVPESLCSLRMNKSGKVFAYSFALAVFIKSPTTSRAPISLHLLRVSLRSWCDLCALAPCAHSWRAGGIGLYMIYFCTAGRCPNQWAVHCRHVRRSHRRYTQTHTRRGGDSTAGKHPSTAGKHLHEHL